MKNLLNIKIEGNQNCLFIKNTNCKILKKRECQNCKFFKENTPENYQKCVVEVKEQIKKYALEHK